MENLNDRQKRFAQEYWLTGHGTNSAIKAGYSKKTAHVQATRLLKNAKIQQLIQKNREEAEQALREQFSRDAIEARKIMFNIMKDDDAPEQVRLSAAKDFLDRAGYKPMDKVEHSGGIDISRQADIVEKYLSDADDD